MKKVKESGTGISGIYITPIIDVALVLVLTLLITAPVLNIPNLPVNLPEAVTEETKERNISVTLTSEGKLSINAEIISPNDLVPKLRAMVKKDKKAVVIIRADKECAYGDVERLLDLIKNGAGAQRIAIGTKQVDTKY